MKGRKPHQIASSPLSGSHLQWSGVDWPRGANLRNTVPHGATVATKFFNHFERSLFFKSPSSHFFFRDFNIL